MEKLFRFSGTDNTRILILEPTMNTSTDILLREYLVLI